MAVHDNMVLGVDLELGGMAKEMGEDLTGEASPILESIEDVGGKKIIADSYDSHVVGRIGFGVPEITAGPGEHEDLPFEDWVSLERERNVADDFLPAFEVFVDFVLVHEDRDVTPVSLIPPKTIHLVDDIEIGVEFWAIVNCVCHMIDEIPLFICGATGRSSRRP